ncbi:MAG: hypothetical protein U0R65_02130 [Candidatus Nanopelagicales bacterium]
MRRSYRADRYLGIIERVRAAMPDAAITTDIIVKVSPGETEDDFAATLDVVRQAQFAGAFTFQYSPRPGTPAATMPDQVPRGGQERYEQLVAVVDEIAWAQNRDQVGRVVDVLVANGEGPQGRAHRAAVGPRAGQPPRSRRGRPRRGRPRPGDIVTAGGDLRGAHHLIADRVLAVRRTRAGDVEESANARDTSVAGVMLGLPTLRA